MKWGREGKISFEVWFSVEKIFNQGVLVFFLCLRWENKVILLNANKNPPFINFLKEKAKAGLPCQQKKILESLFLNFINTRKTGGFRASRTSLTNPKENTANIKQYYTGRNCPRRDDVILKNLREIFLFFIMIIIFSDDSELFFFFYHKFYFFRTRLWRSALNWRKKKSSA